MEGEPPNFEQMLSQMFGFQPNQTPARQSPDERIKPPNQWLSQPVQLQKHKRSVEGTIPAFMCKQVGLDRDDPPEVTVFFDPQTEVVIYDIANRFADE